MNGTLPGKGVTDEQVTDVVTKWMDVQPQKRKTFVFVAGVEDVRWNMKLNRNLQSSGSKVHKWDSFGQEVFDVRT